MINPWVNRNHRKICLGKQFEMTGNSQTLGNLHKVLEAKVSNGQWAVLTFLGKCSDTVSHTHECTVPSQEACGIGAMLWNICCFLKCLRNILTLVREDFRKGYSEDILWNSVHVSLAGLLVLNVSLWPSQEEVWSNKINLYWA
jgi:hypothetical protein